MNLENQFVVSYILEQELVLAKNLAIHIWGSEELANYMCQEDQCKMENSLTDDEVVPEGAEIDSCGMYYCVKNIDGWGHSRWRTKKQIEKMNKRASEENKVGMWDKLHEMSTYEWNNALGISMDVREIQQIIKSRIITLKNMTASLLRLTSQNT